MATLEQMYEDEVVLREKLEAEVERLRTQNEVLREANQRQDAERIGVMNQRNQAWNEVERLRNLYDQADLARAQLELRVTRLRKAVNWLRGALHQEGLSRSTGYHLHTGTADTCEQWECQRARAVLEEEK